MKRLRGMWRKTSGSQMNLCRGICWRESIWSAASSWKTSLLKPTPNFWRTLVDAPLPSLSVYDLLSLPPALPSLSSYRLNEGYLKGIIHLHPWIPSSWSQARKRLFRSRPIGYPSLHGQILRHQNGNPHAMQIDLANVPSETELKLIEREIRLHSGLNHPHCVTLWDTFSE